MQVFLFEIESLKAAKQAVISILSMERSGSECLLCFKSL